MVRRKEIDGLRAIAVAPVILWHAGVNQVSGGFVGVDVFFVISGYLITGLIVSEQTAGVFTIANFYERRARRILPALLLVVGCGAVLAWLWAPLGLLNGYGRSLAAVTVFLSNFIFMGASDYFVAVGQENPLLHTWSLAVEEQFYLIFPLLVLLAWRFGRRTLIVAFALCALVSFALAEGYALRGNSDGFYLLPTRAWELLIGALAAMASVDPAASAGPWRQLASLSGLAAILVAIFTFDSAMAFPSALALLPTLGAAAILLFATPGTWANRLLASPPLVGLGLISYSAYLWHQPLFVFARLRQIHDVPAATKAALIVTTLLLAALTWRFVETPFRDRARVTRRTLVLTLAPASLALLGIGLGFQFLAHMSPPPDLPFRNAILTTIDQRFQQNIGLSGVCDQTGDFHPLPQCQSGPAPTLMVWGDSYAMHLVDGVEIANPGRDIIQATRHLCGPILGVAPLTRKLNAGVAERCIGFNDAVLRYIATQPQIADVVLSGAFAAYLDVKSQLATPQGVRSPDLTFVAERLAATVKAIEGLGKRAWVVSPPPHSGENLGECLEKATLLGVALATCDFSLADERAHDSDVAELLRQVEAAGVKIRWLASALCTDEKCPASEDGVFLYRDGGHLAIEGSRWIGAHTPALRFAGGSP
jgi:peptidoglycan/LPS O-acetylase OafA/YrhL